MVKSELVAALKNALSRGESLESAKTSLLNAGYSKQDINDAAKSLNSGTVPKPKKIKFIPKLPSHPAKKPKNKVKKIKEKKELEHSDLFSKKKKNMPIWVIILIVAVILIIIIFFFTKLLDMGVNVNSSLESFINNSKTCSADSFKQTFSEDLGGILFSGDVNYQIEQEADSCKLSWKYYNLFMDYTEQTKKDLIQGGFTLNEINKLIEDANLELSEVESKTATCKFFNNEELTSVLEQWLQESFSVSYQISLSESTQFQIPGTSAECSFD